MPTKPAPPAKNSRKPAAKAVSLQQDQAFRLLFWLTFMVCSLMMTLTTGILTIQSYYNEWQLSRSQELVVSLLGDTAPEVTSQVAATLAEEPGVDNVQRLSRQEVQDLIAPYLSTEDPVNLPIVFVLESDQTFQRAELQEKLLTLDPTIQLDSAAEALQPVAALVRMVQQGGILFMLILGGLLALMLRMTVIAGIQGQKRALDVLSVLGGTPRNIADLLMAQIWRQLLRSWLAAAVLALSIAALLTLIQPDLGQRLWGWPLWSGLLIGAILPVSAMLFTQRTTRKLIRSVS